LCKYIPNNPSEQACACPPPFTQGRLRKLTRMTVDTQTTVDGEVVPESHVLDFTYDASGNPQTMTCDGVTYYYSVNIQGDVMAILDESGAIMVHYIRQGYGLGYYIVPSNATGSMLNKLNPFGYRGYVRDRETYLYYLESRYYSEDLCRFLNADAYTSTGQGLLGNNMFAYCLNNPIDSRDLTGFFADDAIDSIVGWKRKQYEGGGPVPLGVGGGIIFGLGAIFEFGSDLLSAIFVSPAKSEIFEQEEAVKEEVSYQYWEARRVNNDVIVGRELTLEEACIRVSMGFDLMCANEEAAVVILLLNRYFNPVGPEKHGRPGQDGYYWHYHPNRNSHIHIWYYK